MKQSDPEVAQITSYIRDHEFVTMNFDRDKLT